MTNSLMNQAKYIPGFHCPACFGTEHEKMLRVNAAQNARSRFCEAYICAPCGTQEAFKGFFWREAALKRGIELYVGR